MQPTKSWSFGRQRAEHLAILHLTRRSDLLVSEPRLEADNGVDFLVEICKNSRITGRMFGVQVKASTHLQISPLTENEVKIAHRDGAAIHLPSTLEDLPFPFCLFLFQMEDDEGYYRWLNQPVITEGISELAVNRKNIFKKLTKESLDDIVEQVNGWYAKRHVSEYQYQEVYA